MAERLGLFGGSFDPVHYGHLLLAECCREQAGLHQVIFLPAAVPPHKQERPITPSAYRVEMLELAIAGHEHFCVSRYEAQRQGVTYTVDTLRYFRQEHPQAELFLLLGADMFNDLPHWHGAEEVCRLALPLVARRAGAVEIDFGLLAHLVEPDRLEAIRRHQVEMPAIGISSTDLRRRVAAGRSIRYQTPRAVEEYIRNHGLYR